MIPLEYEPLLSRVEKPGRYVGGEMNATIKDPASVRATMVLAFPDLYDLGMSYHGFRLLYERINASADFAAERVFAPWTDFADALREAQLPLTTLETYRALRDVEVIGFTLQHEMCYTTVLEMLDLGGVAVRASERSEMFPLVIAGGEGAYSPEPMADFIDAFIVGDGEEIALEVLEVVAQAKEKSVGREALLRMLAGLRGVYVPSLYMVDYKEDGTVRSVAAVDGSVPAQIVPRLFDISTDLGSVRPVVPLIRTVQSRTVVEVRRGCVNGCRFCQAGMITRPVRERPVEQIRQIVRENLNNSGDDAVSLLSLSTADYTEIKLLVRSLTEEFGARGISVSLPSLRISSFDVSLAAEISSVRKSTFTFAPEAGSDRLRRIINKPLDEAEFLDIIGDVLRAGWKTLKMYFMLGLPGEQDADLDGIERIIRGALERARKVGVRRFELNVSLSPFVPKAQTPFQWEGQISRDEISRRVNYLRDRVKDRAVSFKTSHLDSSVLEGAMARGDRRLGRVVERAWRGGCRFDAWRETFRPSVWWAAFEEEELDPAWYCERQRDDDEVLPFAHILSTPGTVYLARQRDLARGEGKITPDCVNDVCSGCQACGVPKEHVLARDAEKVAGENAGQDQVPKALPRQRGGKAHMPEAVQRLRLRFDKTGALRFIAHLDLAELIQRIMRCVQTPLAQSQGFNPQPRIMLSPPLPLGFEGRGEVADVLLIKRVDMQAWLKRLREMSSPMGLIWTSVEEIGLKADSPQQTISQFDYRIEWRMWGNEETVLPLSRDEVAAAIGPFMSAESWPIQIVRKNKSQDRDARSFVCAMEAREPGEGFDAALEMSVESREGTTLSPLRILEAIFGAEPAQGVVLRVVRHSVLNDSDDSGK